MIARRCEREQFRLRRALAQVRAKVQHNNLDVLAWAHGTDKASWHHGYADIYQRHLAATRRRTQSVLEIGVGGESSFEGYETSAGGQSLRMWADYFPHAQIVGIDLHPKSIAAPRIAFEQGDQADLRFLHRVVSEYGPFDLVIDDGSHIGRHIVASHSVLWDAVRSGGHYIIEDLSVSYDPAWEGGPPGTPGTGAALLKHLVDHTLERYRQDFQPSIAAMHVYGDTAVLHKR
jgi:cephalosporin hydroxylase